MPEVPKERPVTLRHTAKDLKVAEAKQMTARSDLAKGRASVARGRAAIARGRATLIRRAKAGEPDPGLAPIRTNFDAAEADLDAAAEKLNAAAARIEAAERRLDEAREKARGGGRRRPDRLS
jgi:hypothetical protein